MSSHSNLKPIKLYGSAKSGPNPPKVIMLLEELGLPYETDPVAFANAKSPEVLKVNPNGRLPAIVDPNTDLTLWESGAIMEYLIERYDTTHKLSFAPGTNDAFLAKQWLYFQVSGQGPYYGQAVWFNRYHPEKVQSAIDRYIAEIKRVTGVLEGHLAKQKAEFEGREGFDGPWLVGNKLSYADFSFVPWQAGAVKLFGEGGPYRESAKYDEDDFPLVKEWVAKMNARDSVKKAIDW